MILTVTLNPSVDIGYQVPGFSFDQVHRTSNVSKTAGGKGLNVARVANLLGNNVGATGFLGGPLGSFIRNEVQEAGIEDYFVEIDGKTRNCIAILHDQQQTEILEPGPQIAEKEANKFLSAFKEQVEQATVVTVSGSLPKGLSGSFYKQLITICHEENVPILLDTNGKTLADVLNEEAKPYLIKPNEEELNDLLPDAYDTIPQALEDPLFANIPWVVVTLGKNGAIIKHEDKITELTLPNGLAIRNPVGSGDSVIAGFASAIENKMDRQEWGKYAMAMGVLNAMEEKTGHINVKQIDWCMKHITKTEL